MGLRPDRDGSVAVRPALVLAVGAVAKLFLFDLATLPGLVRALAFIVVGVLLMVIGTWHYRQRDRVRRVDPPDGSPAGACAVTRIRRREVATRRSSRASSTGPAQSAATGRWERHRRDL